MKISDCFSARFAAGLCVLCAVGDVRGESELQSVLAAPILVAQLEGLDPVALSAEEPQTTSESGRVEVIRERFPDGSVFIEREVTLDPEENYVNHGDWRMFDRNGKITAEGRYEMGKRVGPWIRWHDKSTSKTVGAFPFNRFKAPFMSQASFTDGVLDGPWIIVDADNRKVMQVSIEEGKRHDTTLTWSPNGEVLRQQSFEHGVPVGDVLEMRNGSKQMERVATYLNGREIIEKKENHPRSKNPKFAESYLAPKTVVKTPDAFWSLTFAEYEHQGEAVLHGLSRHWHPNGQLKSQGEYAMGAKTGRFTHWHSNGQKRVEGEYVNDLQNGVWVWWHANGQKATIGQYQRGESTGKWRWWAEDGLLAEQKYFDAAAESVSERDAPRLAF